MKKKILSMFVVFALAVAAMFSLAACRVQNTQTGDDDIDADHNEEASVFLTVGTLMDSSERNLMQTWINEFQNLHPEVSIEITKTYNSMPELINYDSTNSLPDICWTAGDQHASYSDPQNLAMFQNLADETKFEGSAEFFDGFYDEIIETTHYKDGDTGIWFVPRDYNRLVIYFNLTVFQNFGIEIPQNGWTWEDFIDTCQALMGAGCAKAVEWRNWAPVHSTMMKNFGAEYIDENGYFAFDSDEGAAVYDWYRNFISSSSGYAITGEGSVFGSYSENTASRPRAAMVVDTYARMSYYTGRAESNNWVCDAVAFPNYVQADGSAGYVGAGCSGYAITKACTDETELSWAWEFLKWCMSREGYDTVADLGVVCPALESMRHSGEWTSYESNGYVVNYTAFVDDSTNDLNLNYQNVLESTTDQETLIGLALELWNNAYATPYSTAVSNMKSAYESATGIRRLS